MRHLARRQLRHLACGVLCDAGGDWELFVRACMRGLSDEQLKTLFVKYIRVETPEGGEITIQNGHSGDFSSYDKLRFVTLILTESRFTRENVGLSIIEQCYLHKGLVSNNTEMLNDILRVNPEHVVIEAFARYHAFFTPDRQLIVPNMRELAMNVVNTMQRALGKDISDVLSEITKWYTGPVYQTKKFELLQLYMQLSVWDQINLYSALCSRSNE
jgi:hypothetical protein